AIPLILAPAPVIAADAGLGLPAATVIRAGVPPRVTVTMHARPRVRLEQKATLTLGSTSATALSRAAATDPLVFEFPDTLAAGSPRGRLAGGGARRRLPRRERPAPRLRRPAADPGAAMNAPVEALRPASVTRLNDWTELNRQWLIAAIACLRQRLDAWIADRA